MSQELTKRIISSIVLIPIALFFIIKGSFLFIFFISICFFIISYEWHLMRKNKPYYFFGFLFLIFSFLSIYRLRISEDDYSWLLLITIICISTDIGGYVFGKLFKGPKLTKLSPNKTYAGMIGGYILSIIFTLYSVQFFDLLISINLLFFVFIISSTSQLGDITISYFKRLSELKDTGKIIPGHGGLLDRLDGMIFAFPLSYILFLIGILE